MSQLLLKTKSLENDNFPRFHWINYEFFAGILNATYFPYMHLKINLTIGFPMNVILTVDTGFDFLRGFI